MKVIHILCLVLMIAMMQHTCLADEQIEITYGDGWTHYNYTDGTQAHKLAPTNYLRWDGEWRPKTEMDFLSGDWPYLVEEFETYYLITRLDDSLTLFKTYKTYDFQPYKIGVQLTLTPAQLNGMSTYHNVGGTSYWYIVIPQSLKQTSKHLNWDSKLPLISNETGFVLNQSDNVSSEWLPNYKYQNVGGELRLYYGQTARSFGIASTEIVFDFNSYIINGSTGWADTSYSNFAYDRNTGYLILPDNVTDELVLYHKMSGSSGFTSYDMNLTSDNNGTLTNMNIGLDNGSSGWNSSGKYGNAIAFDGVDDYVNINDNNGLDFYNGDSITMSARVMRTALCGAAWCPIVSKGGEVANPYRRNYEIAFSTTGTFTFAFRDSAGVAWHIYESTLTYTTLNTWVDVDATFVFGTAASIKLYVDGELVSGSWTHGDGTADPYVSNYPLYIGTTSQTNGYFPGIIDDIRIYSRVLSNDEINQTMLNTMVTSDNVTHWHDAGIGYQTSSFIVNMTTPTNTNYTVWYADNGSSFTQIGGTYTGNQTPSISGTKYQNTDLRIIMNGNSTITPEEMEVTFVTESELTPTPTPASAILVSPVQYDELDLPRILYILTISMLYLLIAFRHGVAAVELSLIYLIFAFFFLLFQTITISVNYIYLTLFLLLFLISIAGITKQGVD